MNVLKEYIEQVLTELRWDDKFIKQLKTMHDRSQVPITSIEHFVDEWLLSNKKLKPEEKRMARRTAIDKYPELLQRFRGNEAAAKQSLFRMLNGAFKKSVK